MIATAKAISHGHAHIEYIKGESPNKKHKDKIFHVCENMLPKYASGAAIWEELCELTADRPRMKNNLIRIIVSPSEDHTKDFTIADWQQLWLDFAREFDGIELRDEKTGEIYSPKTNILGSLYTVELHLESESGVPHLHAAVCRVDKDGSTNNDHDIHLRAQRAAETVAMRRGWKTAAEVSEENTAQIRSDCLDILGGMQQWSLPSFFRRLADRGYDVKVTRDKDGVARGYTVRKGRNCYRASRIDRRLTVSRLEQTWRALHRQAKPASQKPPSPAAQNRTAAQQPTQRRPASFTAPPVAPRSVGFSRYTAPRPGFVQHSFAGKAEVQMVYVPEEAMEVISREFDPRLVANAEQLRDCAVALFVMLSGGDEIAPVSGGGGASDNDRDWGRKEDEDDRQWALRCARQAAARIGVQTAHRRSRR